MGIYFFDDQIGAGLPVWLPNGVAIRDELEGFIRELERRAGYLRVASPHLAREALYERSGHLSCFKDNMFPPLAEPEAEGDKFYLRPMNCPHHHRVFSSAPRSYRQLPLRLAEYGQVYRYEPSGSLRGIARARALCQNDAHIYVAPEGSFLELLEVLKLHELCYARLGLKGYRYRLSKGDSARPGDFPGDPEDWRRAEELLEAALVKLGLEYFPAKGEAAFYGPKIDVQMPMGPSGQEESIASVQLDFLSGERFDLSFVSSEGEPVRPWVIHRAPLGSHERFVAMLLEYFGGRLPGWLSPVQAELIPVGDEERGPAARLAGELRRAGLRARVDEGVGSLSKRIRLAHRARPFAKVIVGEEESASGVYELQLRDGIERLAEGELIERLKDLCRRPID